MFVGRTNPNQNKSGVTQARSEVIQRQTDNWKKGIVLAVGSLACPDGVRS